MPMQTTTHNPQFMTEEQIHDFFTKAIKMSRSGRKNDFEKWYKPHAHHVMTYGHHDKIGKGNYDCDSITDEWFKWFLTNPVPYNPFTNPLSAGSSLDSSPFGSRDLFLFERNGTKVYFTTASPFQKPDFRTITMTEKAPLLIPIYNMSASAADFPSIGNNQNALVNIIKNDLSRLKGESVRASFDGDSIYGCCVIRKDPLKVTIPKENVIGIPIDRLQKIDSEIGIFHGGFWLLIKENQFSSGDHLLSFEANSVNYEMEAKILINALV